MKKTLFLLIPLVIILSSFKEDEESLNIDRVVQACIAMQEADAANDYDALKRAADDLRTSRTTEFKSLLCEDEYAADATLKGHFVFSEDFVDTLIANGEVVAKQQADRIIHTAVHRGSAPRLKGSIKTKNCSVKAGCSTIYSFPAHGAHQEIAVVAEAGGLITMKIHATNDEGFDKWFSDNVDVTSGRPHRKATFDLPRNKRNMVELEIINCSAKDISFVVISN